MAKEMLNGGFEKILKENGYTAVEEIKDEEKAKVILRAIRIAVESKPNMEEVAQ
jgi:hypothetical protein